MSGTSAARGGTTSTAASSAAYCARSFGRVAAAGFGPRAAAFGDFDEAAFGIARGLETAPAVVDASGVRRLAPFEGAAARVGDPDAFGDGGHLFFRLLESVFYAGTRPHEWLFNPVYSPRKT